MRQHAAAINGLGAMSKHKQLQLMHLGGEISRDAKEKARI
jgi:hypothetical protein